MAKLSATGAVSFAFLLFSLAISHARMPHHLPEKDVIDRELPNSVTDSDASSVLSLPSDSVNDESDSTEPAGDSPASKPMSVRSTPLRLVRLRPINRHFPIRSGFPFRNFLLHHHHHHHNHPFFKPIGQQQEKVKIHYGNDMILSSYEGNEFDPLVFHQGRMRRIPAKWIKFHHHDDGHREEEKHDGFSNFGLKHSHRFGKEKFKKHLHHDHDHHEDHDHEEEKNEKMMKPEGKREGQEGAFVSRIRKFLYHF